VIPTYLSFSMLQ